MKSLLATAVAITCFLPIRAHADTYSVSILGNDNELRIYGIEGSGAVVFSTLIIDSCSSPSGTCYLTSTDSTLLNSPPPIIDNGGPAGSGCPALPAFSSPPAFSICNNGHEAYGISSPFSWPGGVTAHGVFDGPDPIADFVGAGFPTPLAIMNSSGDFVYDDGNLDIILEAFDLTSRQAAVTPEPGSLTLLATGALVTAASTRRRWLR